MTKLIQWNDKRGDHAIRPFEREQCKGWPWYQYHEYSDPSCVDEESPYDFLLRASSIWEQREEENRLELIVETQIRIEMSIGLAEHYESVLDDSDGWLQL